MQDQPSVALLELYGTAASRTARVLWALEELGLDYVHHSVNHRTGENRSEAFLAISPMGKIPVLKTGSDLIRQSMAINCHLACKFGSGVLLAADGSEGASGLEWSFWAATEVEPHSYFRLTELAKPSEERDRNALGRGDALLEDALDYLEDALAARDYLLGGNFSLADLNAVGPLEYLQRTSFDFSPYPQITAWLARCQERSAYIKVAAMKNIG